MADEWKAAKPARPTKTQTWRLLDRLAMSQAPGVRRRFLAAVRALRAGIPLAQLESALLRKDTAELLRLLPWQDFRAALATIPDVVVAAAAEAAPIAGAAAVGELRAAGALPELGPITLTAESGGAEAAVGIRFDLTSPHVRDAIAERAGARITEVGAETQRAVRTVIQRAYDGGLHPRAAAQEIRRLVGLTQRQADAVARYRAALEHPAAGAAVLSQKKVDQLVDRMATRLLNERAETIGRTEMITAMSEGQDGAWGQLVTDGILDPSVYEQEWLAVLVGDRTCARCLAMDGKRAPIGGTFEGDPKGPVKGPTLHPRCRCSKVLVRRDTPARTTA